MITQEIYKHNNNSSGIVIFIHGIAESPAPFSEQMDIAYSCGYSVASIVLPGHGGSSLDFAHSNRKQWLEYSLQTIDKYRQKYTKIVLFGHSMGGLLSVLAYTCNPEKITGIIAHDTPLYVFVRMRAVRNLLKIGLCNRINESDSAYNLLEYMGVEQGAALSYALWLPRIADLFYLMRKTRSSLNKIRVPMLVLHADKDELVAKSSIKCFKRNVDSNYIKIINLTESSYFYIDSIDKATIKRQLKEFLLKQTNF